MEIKDFKVGQTVYLKPVNWRHSREKVGYIQDEVATIGKKYITLKNINGLKFGNKYEKADGRFTDITNYSASYEIYFDYQTVLDENLESELRYKVKNHNFTFEQLKQINELFFTPLPITAGEI